MPRTLLAADLPKSGLILLPITIVKFEGGERQTIELTTKLSQGRGDRCFWTELNEKIKLLEIILAGHQFGKLTEAEVDQLKVGSMILPKLIGRDARLLYTEPPKAEDRINKSSYKAYLGMLAALQGSLGRIINPSYTPHT